MRVTPEDVLRKIYQLQSIQDKAGNHNHMFGVDTLSMLFDTPFDYMMNILEVLKEKGQVAMTELKTKRTGKNNVAYVSLK